MLGMRGPTGRRGPADAFALGAATATAGSRPPSFLGTSGVERVTRSFPSRLATGDALDAPVASLCAAASQRRRSMRR